MTKEELAKCPKWKRDKSKRSLSLFWFLARFCFKMMSLYKWYKNQFEKIGVEWIAKYVGKILVMISARILSCFHGSDVRKEGRNLCRKI
jgi:hypothetical protein